MIANSATAAQLATFIADELGRSEDEENALSDSFRLHCTRSCLITENMPRPLLILWMIDRWSYSFFTAESVALEIAEIAGEFTDHILGIEIPPRVIIALKDKQ